MINADKLMYESMEENNEIFKYHYNKYLLDYTAILSLAIKDEICPDNISFEKYSAIELNYYKEHKINKLNLSKATLKVTYNGFYKEKTFSYEELIDIINGINPPIMTSKRKKEKEIENFVKDKSNLLQNLSKINQNYFFNNSEYQKKYDIYCIKRLEYNEFDFDKELVALLRKDICGYENLLEQYRNNVKKYEKYCKEYVALKELSVKQETYSFEIDFNKFKTIENKFYTEWKKNPPVKP